MTRIKTDLVEGDALKPDSNDLLVQRTHLPVGEPVPEGWRVLTGNNEASLIARVAYRFECEGE